MINEIIMGSIAALIFVFLVIDAIKVSKHNFCSTCKYFKAITYCTHPFYKEYNYVSGSSYSPMADRVRGDRPHCRKWEKKDEETNSVPTKSN